MSRVEKKRLNRIEKFLKIAKKEGDPFFLFLGDSVNVEWVRIYLSWRKEKRENILKFLKVRGAKLLPFITFVFESTPSLSRNIALFINYHFIFLICRSGWETKQCHTTEWKDSEYGVTNFLSTVGTTTTRSPNFLV